MSWQKWWARFFYCCAGAAGAAFAYGDYQLVGLYAMVGFGAAFMADKEW